jgi:thiol:disulfide interchange protein DsbC
MYKFLANLAVLAAFVMAVGGAQAGGTEDGIKKNLKTKFPEAKTLAITKIQVGSLYEVVVDGEFVFYTDDKVNFILNGNLFDGKTQRNLTELKMTELHKAQFDKMPFDSAIKQVKGNGKRVMAVFSDVDCPYCRRLEDELAKITDVTIYTFLYPIDSLHPNAAQKSKAVWCSPDRNKAWNDLISKGIEPKNPGTCDTPLPKILELGARMGVRGTPAIFFADGRRSPGLVPADQLENYLNGK